MVSSLGVRVPVVWRKVGAARKSFDLGLPSVPCPTKGTGCCVPVSAFAARPVVHPEFMNSGGRQGYLYSGIGMRLMCWVCVFCGGALPHCSMRWCGFRSATGSNALVRLNYSRKG